MVVQVVSDFDYKDGMLYTFFDVACFFACLTLLEADKHPVSIETHTSVLRAAFKGDRVMIRARVDRLGRTLAAMRADALAVKPDGSEKLIATGSVTKSIITPGGA
jgi:acyl-coenzyme A thioesterase PaaI-like protein